MITLKKIASENQNGVIYLFLPSLEIFNFKEAIIFKISNTPHTYAYNSFPALWMQIKTNFVFIFCWSRDVINGIPLAATENPGG